MLPSPCGDMLFPPTPTPAKCSPSYRPLAGISCFCEGRHNIPDAVELPSPRGDKLFQLPSAAHRAGIPLPSPRGDKLFLYGKTGAWRIYMLPSPRGDKLFPALFCNNLFLLCYRPLAGISCFWTATPADLHSGRYRPLAGISCFNELERRRK